jgi:large subunit ribosomal protein L18
MDKTLSRLRRAKQTRARIKEQLATRLAVHRTNTHIYASIISGDGDKVLVAASTVQADVKKALDGKSGLGGNAAAAAVVGKAIAEKALKAGITEVAFDRAGFRYHGRVKALAEAAREAGLKF